MGRIGASMRKPHQPKASSLSNIKISVGLLPVGRIDGLPAIEYQEVDIQIAYQLHQLPIEAISGDAVLMEQFFGNDSLGG